MNIPGIADSALYRVQTAGNVEADAYSLYGWQRIFEIETADIEVSGELNVDLLKNALGNIKKLMFYDVQIINNELKNIFSGGNVKNIILICNITIKRKERAMKKQITAILLCLTLMPLPAIMLSGCGTSASANSTDLMTDIEPNPVETVGLAADKSVAVTDFGVRLFQVSLSDNGNTLISPVSVLYALAMTANGAEGETLAQMEEMFGISVEDLNVYLHSYMDQLPEDEKYKLSIANSIWFKDDESLTIEPEFLQANADYYGAGLYKAPFDESTLNEINGWVSDNTDGMIENILERISEDAFMYLINAMAFDAEWHKVYEEAQVHDGKFTQEDGAVQDIQLMYSREYKYLEDENAVGFMKYYKDNKYAYAALLPDEGVTVADYISSLTGKRLNEMLKNPQDIHVNAAIPKYESEYSIAMNEALKAMGMVEAFDVNLADFSGMGSSEAGNFFVGLVQHKTFISVGEQGTKAGAATAVEMLTGSEMAPEIDVYLDRPFVYMIIDCEANLPLFIGTVMEI